MAKSPFSSSYFIPSRSSLFYSGPASSKYASFYSGGGPGWTGKSDIAGGGLTPRQAVILALAKKGKTGQGRNLASELLHGASGPLKGTLGAVGWGLNQIMRPSYGMARGADLAWSVDPNHPLARMEAFGKGFSQGFTLKKKEGFGQVLGKHGVLTGHRHLRGLTGFGLDVVTDPSMLLSAALAPETGGGSLAAYEAAKASGESVSRELVQKAAREAGQRALKGSSDEIVGDALKVGGKKFQLRHSLWEQNKHIADLESSKENPFTLQFKHAAALTEKNIRSVGAYAEAGKYDPHKAVLYWGTRKHNIHIPLFPSISDPGEKLAEREIPILSNIAGSLGRKFSPGFTDKALFKMELARQHAAEQGYVGLQHFITESFKGVHLANPEEELNALHYFEQPLRYGKSKRKWAAVLRPKGSTSPILNEKYIKFLKDNGYINDAQETFVRHYKHATDTIIQFEKAAGVKVEHLAGNRMYVPHVTLRNGASAEQKISQAGLTVEAGFQKARKGAQLSVKQIADMVKQNPALHGIETDPIKLLLTRARSSAERQADMGLIHSLAAGVGIPTRLVDAKAVARGVQRLKTAAAQHAAALKLGAAQEQAYHDAVDASDALVRNQHNANLRALNTMRKEEEARIVEQTKAAKAAAKAAPRKAAPKAEAKAVEAAPVEPVKVAPAKNAGTRVRNATINVTRGGNGGRLITLEHGGDILARASISSPGKGMGWTVESVHINSAFKDAGAGQRLLLMAKGRFPSLKYDKSILEKNLPEAKELRPAEAVAPARRAKGAGRNIVPKVKAVSTAADKRAKAAIKSAEVTVGRKGADRVISLAHGKSTIGSVTITKADVGWKVKSISLGARYKGKGATARLLREAKRKFPGLKYDQALIEKDKAPIVKAAPSVKVPPAPKARAPRAPGRVPAPKPKPVKIDTSKLDKINADIAAAKANFSKMKDAAKNPKAPLHKELFKDQLSGLQAAQEAKDAAQKEMAQATKFLRTARYGKANREFNKGLHTVVPGVLDEHGNPIAFPHATANTSLKLQRLISGDDQEVTRFTKAVRGWMSAWKVMVTSVNPGYRIRNTMTDFWNMYLARVPGWAMLTYGKKAASLMKAAAKGDPAAMDRLLEFGHHGILAGLFGGDIQAASKTVRGLTGAGQYARRGNLPKAWVKFTQDVNRNAENWGRITHMMYRMDHLGESAAEAAHAVKIAHFDYSELTPFEQNYLKNVFPFYTWTRKNIPYQVKKIFQEPGRYSAFPKLANEASYQSGNPNISVPNYLEQGLAFPIGKNTLYTPQFGVADLQPLEGPHQAIQRVEQMVNPFIKDPFELAANKSLFTGQSIESDKHPRVPVSPLGAALLSMIPGSNVGTTARTGASGTVYGPGANAKMAYILGQTPLSRLLGISGGGISGKRNAIGGKIPPAIISELFGQSVSNVNPADQNYYSQIQLENMADKLLQGLKDQKSYTPKKRKKSRFDKIIQAQLRSQYGG